MLFSQKATLEPNKYSSESLLFPQTHFGRTEDSRNFFNTWDMLNPYSSCQDSEHPLFTLC